MSKTLAVFGATGQQGNSILQFVLNDVELSQQYRLRAITRDVNTDKLRDIRDRIEIVQADVSDRASLQKALAGVHTVFAMTNPDFGPGGFNNEYNQGKTIADVSVETGVQYIIFSTLPSVKTITSGKYTKCVHFEAKAAAERYIRTLPIDSAFFCPAFFMQNFETIPFLGPKRTPDGTYVVARHNAPQTRFPFIDAVGDTGKFVGAILAEPERYKGETFCAATKHYSLQDMATILSKATGKTVNYQQISLEEWKASLPFGQDIFPEAFSYIEEFGCYGPDSENLVAWAAEHARGTPSTLEQYLEAHPMQLA